MMTDITLKQVLEQDGLTPHKSSTEKEIHYGCPVCGSQNDPDSDRLRLTVAIDKVTCRTCGGGANYPIGYLQWRYGKDSWRPHAERLGITLNSSSNGATPNATSKADLSKAPEEVVTIVTPPDLTDVTPPTKSTYTDLADFCENKVGIPLWFAQKALRWAETNHGGEPAVKMEMDDGSFRIRPLNNKTFIQIRAPENKDKKANPATWYMFPPDDKTLIVLCNGQTSVAAAQFHNIDAFCFTDGEKAIPNYLLKRLQSRFAANKDTVCIIALDGDVAGRKAAKGIEKQLAGYPIRVVDFGGKNGYDLGDFCKKNNSNSLQRLIELSRVPDNAQIASSKQVSDGLADIIANSERFATNAEYMPIPFRSFHKYGGMMKVLHPGKVAIIGAPSGHGKTSFMETWVDAWMQQGFDVLWWGSEWSPFEYGVRRIQRYGGMTVDQYTDHQIWKREDQLNVVAAQRFGAKLPNDVLVKSLQAGRTIKSWPGRCWYFPKRPYIEDTQEEMRAILHHLRREGRRVACVVWDYVSLMRSRDGDANNQPQAVLGAIKDFSLETQLATLAGSQVNKTATARIRSGDVSPLVTSDLYYIREDDGNLVLGLNPIYKKDPYGTPEFTKRIRAEILKNSLGQPYGHVMLNAKFSRLAVGEV